MSRIAGDIYGGARAARQLARAPAARALVERLRVLPQLLAGVGWSSLPWLRLLAQPTLVMYGADDPLVPAANARILAGLIPDSRLVSSMTGTSSSSPAQPNRRG